MSNTRMAALTAVAALAASAAVLFPAAAANAQADSTLCNQNTSCYWPSANFGGQQWVAPSCGVWDLSGAQSVKNYGHGTVYLYSGYGLTGSLLAAVPVGSARASIGGVAHSVSITC
ncbi:hypothetical protein [Streptomyces mexicanus]|uniref:hypothetical protein n=1 Tax=Streptomyces mexicanus TaxID=178566 RepID=UPI0031ED76B5